MKWFHAHLLKSLTGIAVVLAVITCLGGPSRILAAEAVAIQDYMIPSGEGSSWIYSKSENGIDQGLATRITLKAIVVGDSANLQMGRMEDQESYSLISLCVPSRPLRLCDTKFSALIEQEGHFPFQIGSNWLLPNFFRR